MTDHIMEETVNEINAGNSLPAFTSSYNPNVERERFRKKLRYFFMNPIDKWKVKGKLPWKLGLQVIKIIIVTLQLLIFGSNMSKYLTHQGTLVVTFRELFMADWDPVREVMTYPPTAGPYAVYTRHDLYSHINKAIAVYSDFTESAIGIFGYGRNVSAENRMSPILFCKEYYAHGEAIPTTFFYNYTNLMEYECLEIFNETMQPGDPSWHDFSIEEYLKVHNFSLAFERLNFITLSFPVRTIYLNTMDHSDEPDCYDVNITITYDNTLHDGQTLINLESQNIRKPCNGRIDHTDDYRKTYAVVTLNIFVIALSTISLLLCLRSMYRANKLRRQTVEFIKYNLGKDLNLQDQMYFIDFWMVMIIVNDIMIIIGSVIKLMLEKRVFESIHFSSCSFFLGIGNLLVWMGLLRYLGFFRKYNVLILTIRKALPNILRFMLCTILLYGGFCLCGWLILGPYHIKFTQLSTTSECLFSLLNGDDMFATFEALDPKAPRSIWWFSRLYLYIFISLFIYIILSLAISIIMDAYDTIKNYYETGFPLSELQRFVAESPEESYNDSEPAQSEYNHGFSGETDVTAGGSVGTTFAGMWDKFKGRGRTEYQRI